MIYPEILRTQNSQAANDSYRAFRSDFIHFSFSLVASTQERYKTTNALHLTPKAFTHFWTWCSLFDSIPTLPIRSGSYYVPRIIAPKFGRHIATIKYRILLTRLFVMHGYIDDSRESEFFPFADKNYRFYKSSSSMDSWHHTMDRG